MLNQVILEGRLGRDPDIFMTQHGRQIAKFSLATSTTWKDETGEWQTKVHWHEIVVHRDSTIRWIKDVLKQGDLVHVEGRLTYHHWEDRHNQQRRKARIIVSERYGKVERPLEERATSKPLSALIEDIPEFDEASEDSDHHPFEDIPFFTPQARGKIHESLSTVLARSISAFKKDPETSSG